LKKCLYLSGVLRKLKTVCYSVGVKEYTDIEIIECLRKRQSYVVHFLSERFMPMIRLMVCQKGGSTDDAKDIFQEGLIIMIGKIDDGDFTLTCKFKTYLYSVCLNLWKSVLDKRQAANNYQERRIDEDYNKDFTELQDREVYENIFYNAFTKLDEVCQIILKLYWQDLSPQEIANKLGYTYSYVKKKKCEGQAELIAGVKNHPDYKRLMRSEDLIKKVVY
jgi:RNA polymerase sigma factor (sigma-70 family)